MSVAPISDPRISGAAPLHGESPGSSAPSEFDELARLAAKTCDAPIALISLLDREKEWFRSKIGLEECETPLVVEFCARLASGSGLLEVPDAAADPRFRDTLPETGEPGIRFCAGVPLIAPDGSRLGTLCVIDRRPRKLTSGERETLALLSRWVVRQLEIEALSRQLAAKNKELSDFKAALDEHAIVAITDARGKITYVNDKFCAISRYAREELIGRDHRIVNSQHHPKAFIRDLWQTITSGRVWRGEIKNKTKDGRFYWVDTTIVPFVGADGKPAQYIAIRADITQRRDAEDEILRNAQAKKAEADAASSAKSRFLATISHEIRTPLNAIMGYSQLMLNDPSVEAATKVNLRTINRSGEHLLSLINDVLDMSAIEAGRIELHPSAFSICELMDGLAEMFHLRAKAKGLEFSRVLDSESLQYLISDQGKIRQTLINLLSNAIKFTERGRIRLHITLKQRPDARLWFSASVEDTGAGIPEKDLNILFQPFTQVGNHAGQQEGTGLGLAISRELARIMGGDLTVAGNPGGGSIFLFEIPVQTADLACAGQQPTLPRAVRIRAGQAVPRILVADDQFESRDWLVKLLTILGFCARGVEDGQAAVQAWEEWRPHLILMDINMPVMDGFAATRKIKADPKSSETIIIVLTAAVLDDQRQIACELGINDFVAKPCKENQLIETIGKHLNLSFDYEEPRDQSYPHFRTVSGQNTGVHEDGPSPQALGKLAEAVRGGRKKAIDQLIDQIGCAGGAELAGTLSALAKNYQYDELLRLVEDKRP